MTLPAGSSKGKSKMYIVSIIALIIVIVIGIDLYNKFQPPDQIVELLDGEIETWHENLVLCNAIDSIDDLLFHVDYTKDDRYITMAATRSIPVDKMTAEIDTKISELSKLIDKNADCLNSKSDQFQ